MSNYTVETVSSPLAPLQAEKRKIELTKKQLEYLDMLLLKIGRKSRMNYEPAIFERNEDGSIYCDGYRDYIQEYTEIIMEWHERGINIDTAPFEDIVRLKKAKINALINTGLDEEELRVISICRKYKHTPLFYFVHNYVRFFNMRGD